MSTVDN